MSSLSLTLPKTNLSIVGLTDAAQNEAQVHCFRLKKGARFEELLQGWRDADCCRLAVEKVGKLLALTNPYSLIENRRVVLALPPHLRGRRNNSKATKSKASGDTDNLRIPPGRDRDC